MALNTGEAPQQFSLGGKGLTLAMTGQSLDTRAVLINGKPPGLALDGTPTALDGSRVVGADPMVGHGIALYAVSGGHNRACR